MFEDKWIEYSEFKSFLSEVEKKISGKRLLDIIGSTLLTEKGEIEWHNNSDVVLKFENNLLLSFSTKCLYLWRINLFSNINEFNELVNFENGSTEKISLITFLNLESVKNQKFINFTPHKQFKYQNKNDYNEYDGVLLNFDSKILHIYDIGDELGIRVINENINNLKEFIVP